MRRNKILLIIFIILIPILAHVAFKKKYNMSSISSEAKTAEFILKYGEVNTNGHIMSETAYYFAKQVNELSNGEIIIEIYPSGQLGDDTQCYRSLKMGSLDIYRGNSASLSSEINALISAMSLPYLFTNRNHFWNVCNSELGDKILEDVQHSFPGIRALAFLDEGARNFFTTDKPITSLNDMEGLEVRMQSSSIMIDTALSLGAIPAQSEYIELYYSLQSKTIDGAENPPISYYYNKFYEVAPYYVKDAHTYSPSVMLISELTWNNLGNKYQDLIMEAAKLAQEYNKSKLIIDEEEIYINLRKEGVNITELTDMDEWRKATKPLYDKYNQFSDIIEEIKKLD